MTRYRAIKLIEGVVADFNLYSITMNNRDVSPIDMVLVGNGVDSAIITIETDKGLYRFRMNATFIRMVNCIKISEKGVKVIHILLTGNDFRVMVSEDVEQMKILFNQAMSDVIEQNTPLSVEDCVSQIATILRRVK